MEFRNERHKAAFKDAIKKMDKKDNVQMCIVYLLTADRKLWLTARMYMIDKKIPIHRVRVKRCSEHGYTLFCCAKDLALGTRLLSMNDLADKELIPPEIWRIVHIAMDIKRFGLPKEHYTGEKK
ncbi:MAG: hypothetical protein IJ393_00755 [Clostridia bacterium]|nr:hypothetical protein [Clostridia bacterium]